MARSPILVMLLLVAAKLGAQSPPPTCFGFNMTAPGLDDPMQFSIASPLTVFFTAPQTVTVDQVVLFEDANANATMRVAIHAMNPATGFPMVSALGVAPAGPYFGAAGWSAKTLTPAVSMVAGTPYAMVCTAVPTNTNFPGFGGPVLAATFLLFQQPGSTFLPYTGGGPNPFGPVASAGFKFGFQGPTCGGRLAELQVGGPPCGGGTPWQPVLSTASGIYGDGGRPRLGQILWLGLGVGPGVPTNAPTAFYWSVGSNLAGTSLGPTSPCFHWLNPTSLASLFAAGAEPLGAGFWTSTGPSMAVLVPNAPSIIGMAVAIQAVVIDPAGVPSGIPGLTIRLSSSLTLVPGL